jgi:hypothetical protein
MTYAEYVHYCESFNAFMEKEGMCNLSTSPYKCPECHKDSGQFSPEPDHTCRPCNCCDRSTGELWNANGWSGRDQEIKEFRICRDCEYFAEYGRLDDMTMMEVEKDKQRPDRTKLCASLSVEEELPAYAWPGGYPLVYLCEDNGSLCPDCANGKNGAETLGIDARDDKDWNVVSFYVHYEGPPVICDHCNAEVESAYGDPEEQENA